MHSPSAAAPRCRWRARRSSPRQSCQISRAGGLWSRCASGCSRAGSSEPPLPCPAAARDLPLRSLSWSSCVGGVPCLERPCPCRRRPWPPARPSASASRSRSRTRTSAMPTASSRHRLRFAEGVFQRTHSHRRRRITSYHEFSTHHPDHAKPSPPRLQTPTPAPTRRCSCCACAGRGPPAAARPQPP